MTSSGRDMSSPIPTLNRRSSIVDYFSSLPRRPRLPSIRSRKSNASINSDIVRDSYYAPYAVHQQNMAPIIMRDPEAMRKLLECILESQGGRKSLARLARTCKAFKDPTLDMLWRDLDSFVPLLTLFPNTLMKRTRRPALGLAREPEPADWEKVLVYGERVHSVTYVESFNLMSQTIFPILASCPRQHLLPNLTALTWKAETLTGLHYSRPYLTTKLQTFTLEMGIRAPKINDFLDEVMSRTQLSSFSFTLHSNLPENFVETVQSQSRMEKLALMVPGALASRVGKWTSTLPLLRSLQLDMTNASSRAVEGFFNDISPGSGYSTPSSVSGTDSGVFSAEDEVDFSEFRKSAVRLTSDGPRRGPFAQLTQVNLMGEAGIVATFLKHVTSPLTQLELSIDDPPAPNEWKDLCTLLSDQFGQTLQTLRISASSAARFAELVRSTSRGGDVQLRHLPLEHFGPLPRLKRLEIELPESAIFHNVDVAHIARVCPNLEVARLCGQARFPPAFGPPYLTLEGIIPLTSRCKRLHTLAVVVNALDGRDEVYKELELSSRALVRLNVGHSWVRSPLETAILISHIAPHLESLKWFGQASRSNAAESNAANWQKVDEFLPPMQRMRLIERSLLPKPVVLPPPPKADKQIDATVRTVSRGVSVKPPYVDSFTQITPPAMIDVEIECSPQVSSVEIDATPIYAEQEVDAVPDSSEKGVDAVPETNEKGIDAFEPEPALSDSSDESTVSHFSLQPILSTFAPSFHGLVNMPIRAVRVYTYYFSLPLRYMLSFTPLMSKVASSTHAKIEDESESTASSPNDEEISEKSMNHMSISTSTDDIVIADENTLLADVTPDFTHELDDLDEIPCVDSKLAEHESPRESVFHFPSELTRKPKWATSAPDHVKVALNGIAPTRLNATRQSQALGPSAAADTLPDTWFIKPIQYRNYDMSDPKKQEKDYTKEVDELLPQTKSLAESGKLEEAIEKLLVIEKQTRNASDLTSTTRLVKEICQLSYDARNYTVLNQNIQLLSKKHGQLKASIQEMVEQAMGWLPEIKEREGVEKWLELIDTLRSVTEGKIFLETPRARVTLLLAHHHELLANDPTPTSPSRKESKQTASDLVSELQVETYSSMERREKTEFLLEQMRLLILVAKEKDSEKGLEGKTNAIGGGEAEWVKVRVAGRKVNEGFLALKDNEDLKLKFYDMMIQYALQQSEYLDATKYFHKVWETPSIKEDVDGRGREALEHIVYYIVLAPHGNEQSDMLHRLYNDPALSKLELHHALVKCFTTPELMRWPGIESIYGPHLRKTSVFSSDKLWEDLHTRVIEHNIRIVAQYYTRITLARLTALLDLTPRETEETLSRLVVSKAIWARVDRPAGIINFRQARTAEDVMNDWSSDMSRLLGLIEKTWMGVNAAQAAQSKIKA